MIKTQIGSITGFDDAEIIELREEDSEKESSSIFKEAVNDSTCVNR